MQDNKESSQTPRHHRVTPFSVKLISKNLDHLFYKYIWFKFPSLYILYNSIFIYLFINKGVTIIIEKINYFVMSPSFFLFAQIIVSMNVQVEESTYIKIS